MTLAGIDYSMTCPAVAVLPHDEWDDDRVRLHALTSRKSTVGTYLDGRVTVDPMPEYSCNEERFDALSAWVIGILERHGCRRVAIEGYSFGSKGQVYQIGENGGVLRDRLWRAGVVHSTLAPSEVKRVAGKGNLDKVGMESAFRTRTGIDLPAVLGTKRRGDSPVSDLVDAYFVCLALYQKLVDNGPVTQ